MFVTQISKVPFSYWFGIGQTELLLVQHMEINHGALQFPPHINAKKTKLSKFQDIHVSTTSKNRKK